MRSAVIVHALPNHRLPSAKRPNIISLHVIQVTLESVFTSKALRTSFKHMRIDTAGQGLPCHDNSAHKAKQGLVTGLAKSCADTRSTLHEGPGIFADPGLAGALDGLGVSMGHRILNVGHNMLQMVMRVLIPPRGGGTVT